MSRPYSPGKANPATPTSNPVMKRILIYGTVLAAAIAVVGAVTGGLIVGPAGIASALIGTGMTLVFLGITAASILVANRFTGSDLFVGAFFGIVLGSWIVKFVLFIIILLVLDDQAWIAPVVLFACIVASVVGSLTVDVIVVVRSRMPYASDAVIPEPDSGEVDHVESRRDPGENTAG